MRNNDRIEGLSNDKVRLLQLLLRDRSRRGEESASQEILKVARVADGPFVQLPASDAQQRVWLVDQMEGGGAAYHIPIAMRLRGSLDEQALQQALDGLVGRHEVLRTTYAVVDGDLKQRIATHGTFSFKSIDLTTLEASRRLEQVELHKQLESKAVFDLDTGPLIRGRLLRIHADEFLLLITVHHIVFDGWSMNVFFEELQEMYRAYRQRQQPALSPLHIQYADYAQWHRRWLQSGALQGQLDYWLERLRGACLHLDLPADRQRAVSQSYRGDNVETSLGLELSAHLREFARCRGLTPFMVFHAAWSALLYRLTDQQDVLVGTPVANRQRPELEGLIGFFANTIVLRMQLDDEMTIDQLLAQARETTLGAFDNQDVPFEKLVEALHPQRLKGKNPVFQVMLTIQSELRRHPTLPGVAVSLELGMEQGAMFDLLLSVDDSSEDIVLTLNYATDLFSSGCADRWLQSLRWVLPAVTGDVHAKIGELTLLTDDQRRLIESFNGSAIACEQPRPIHERFEAQVFRSPTAIAATCENRSLSYAELNEKANQLAWLLRSKGVGRDHRVAICVDRHLMMIVGILGILKAGGGYVPLDPHYPRERLDFVLSDAAPTVLLVEEHLQDRMSPSGIQTLIMSEGYEQLDGWPVENVPLATSEADSHALAYVIYTSGSTGRPKGVMVEHGNVARLFTSTEQWFSFNDRDVWTLFHSFAFDFSVWELWGALLYGGRVVVVPYLIARSPHEFYSLLCREGVTVLNQTPSAFTQLIDAQESNVEMKHSLRVVVFGGEALELRTLRRWVERNGADRPKLVNMYGITETTVHVTYQPLTEGQIFSERSSIIGRQIPDLQLYLLDRCRNPTPLGVTGEIYVGGAGVARGYLNRPELTQERFVTHAVYPGNIARLYKTGDLARWREDGQIEYLGRNDHQVKIRGFRIELGEIEAQIARHPQVKEAVVIAQEDSRGEKRLIAYVVPESNMQLRSDELRTHLRAGLPDYMLPGAFVCLERLPMTLNGKLDTRALPAPDFAGEGARPYEPPQGEIEQRLAQIWQELLGLQQVGRQDNFFETGGHSMLAIKALSRTNEMLGCALRVVDIYMYPTIRELAARIRGGSVPDEELVDLESEAILVRSVRGAGAVEGGGRRQKVLLTGATGFVGRFLLARLLQEERAGVYCLVRATSEYLGMARIKKTLQIWDLWRDEYEQRITAVLGDLRLPRLGLDDEWYSRLARSIDSIYHCATSMNHLESYAMAKAANVGGVSELLKLAVTERTKLVNYVSTFSVFSPLTSEAARVINERSSIDGERHPVSCGYAASKWVGEKILLKAQDRGIPCNVFRIGLVWADAQGGRYDELQNVYRVIKSSLLSGYGIQGYLSGAAPTPVDYVASAIVYLANKYRNGGGIFHVSSPHGHYEGLFERCNSQLGTSLELKPYFEWIGEMKKLHQSGWSLPAVPLIEFAFSMSREAFDRHQYDTRDEKIVFDCDETYRLLEPAGIVAPVLDGQMIAACIDSMRRRDTDFQQATNKPVRIAR
ncbi:non-ribosomal peptide synthetase family protein [Peristeroidobacter agariperforans]|uniref:non-ribosomal peptide synthetase family protein n=1 Tax=Peristeroidobacter agariperforans TaxID=268404 RepID=UPI00101C4989|nr:non-ribosomal peptide synthetase [Peristeroidobacter agariperforans]